MEILSACSAADSIDVAVRRIDMCDLAQALSRMPPKTDKSHSWFMTKVESNMVIAHTSRTTNGQRPVKAWLGRINWLLGAEPAMSSPCVEIRNHKRRAPWLQ